MNTTEQHTTAPGRAPLARYAAIGAGSGVVASLAMALYAMLAAWAKDTGFFTPLHHIASLVVADDAMMSSMQAGMAGSAFHLEVGPAVLGAAIHMMTGAAYGAAFGVLLSRLHLPLVGVAGVGIAYGAAVFAMSAWVGLPIAAEVFSSGDQISSMASMAGWGTFVIEHLIYGLVLGLLSVRATSRLNHHH